MLYVIDVGVVVNPHEEKHAYDTLRALGDAVALCSSVYLWPFEQCGKDATVAKPAFYTSNAL